jgi:hypothetical protein
MVYICGYEGEEFRTWYKLELKVNGRTKPADYIAEDDEKIYSYNALEWKVDNTVVELTRANENLHARINVENEAFRAQIIDEVGTLNANTLDSVDEKVEDMIDVVNNGIGLAMGAKSGTTTFNEDGSITTTYTDGTSEHTTFNEDGSINQRLDWGDMGVRNAHIEFNADGSITTTFTEEASE